MNRHSRVGRFVTSAVILAAGVSLVSSGVWLLASPSAIAVATSESALVAEAELPFSAPVSRESGELYFPDAEQNLGILSEPRRVVFRVENRGRRDVRLLGVQSSCSCSQVRLGCEYLRPGESTEVSGELNLQSVDYGPHTFSLTVRYEGAEIRSERLLMHARKSADVVVPGPQQLVSRDGRSTACAFRLVDMRDQPLAVASVESSDPRLTVDVVERPASYSPGWTYTFRANFADDGAQPAAHAMSVTIGTNDPLRPIITVPFSVRVESRLRVVPNPIRLTADAAGRFAGRAVIVDADGEPVVAELADMPSTLTGRVQTSGTGPAIIDVSGDAAVPLTAIATFRVKILRPVPQTITLEVQPWKDASLPSP